MEYRSCWPNSNLNKIHSTANYLWGQHGHISIKVLDNGLLLFYFRSLEACAFVMENGPWHINNCHIILWHWERDIQLLDFKQRKVQVWVKLSKVPLELLTSQGLSYLASGLGNPICFEQGNVSISHGNIVKAA